MTVPKKLQNFLLLGGSSRSDELVKPKLRCHNLGGSHPYNTERCTRLWKEDNCWDACDVERASREWVLINIYLDDPDVRVGCGEGFKFFGDLLARLAPRRPEINNDWAA